MIYSYSARHRMHESKWLKSKYHQKGYWTNPTNLEPWSKGIKYPVITHPIKDLWPSVPKAEVHAGVEFYKPLKESIQKEGLHNPLITVKCTRQQLKGQKAKWGKELNELPFWIAEDLDKEMLVIWGGSNRLYAAIELGYTHVDCVMIPTFEEARKLQKTHRSTHPQLYAHDWRK